MKKQFLAYLLVTTTVLAGCGGAGSGEGGSGDKLVIALRSGTYSDVVQACLPGFEGKYGIECEVEEFSEDDLHSTLLNNSVNSGGGYDLCMADSSWVSELMSAGALSNLSDLGYEFDDDIIPATTSICRREDGVYLVPYYGNVTVMLYNKKLLSEAGYSEKGLTSFGQVMDLCKYASGNGKGGFIYRGDTNNNIVVDFLPVLCAHGGWVVDENNHPTVDTPVFAEAMKYYMELTATGEALTKDMLISSLEDGEGAAAVGWPGWCQPSDESKIGYFPVPNRFSDDGESHNSCIYGIWTMGIPENSRNKEMASKLLEYLMDPEVQKNTVEYGGVPCRYSCLRDPEVLEEFPHYEVICEALENGVYRPDMETWPQFYEILGKNMDKILKGEISVEEGLKIAQEGLENL